MRRLSLLLLLTACDLQPAKQKKSTEPAPAVAPVDAATEPAKAQDAGVQPIKASAECIEVGTHLAKLVIAAMIDEAAKAKQKENEATTIKSSAETCSKDKWTAVGRSCLLASKSLQETNLCDVKPPTE